MNYIGSKHRLLPFLTENICKIVNADLSKMVFCDLFAGTGIVGKTFKSSVKQLIANDCEYYSYVLNRNYIGIEIDEHYCDLSKIRILDSCNGISSKVFFISS